MEKPISETEVEIEKEGYKAGALGEIAIQYAKAGQFSKALETVKTIEDSTIKFLALGEIARHCAEAGEKEKAAQSLTQALETAKTRIESQINQTENDGDDEQPAPPLGHRIVVFLKGLIPDMTHSLTRCELRLALHVEE